MIQHEGPRPVAEWLIPRVTAHALAAVLLLSLIGCGTASRAVRLDTGARKTVVFTPRGSGSPVQLREGELEAALRRLMAGSVWHEDVYLTWTGRLELDSEGGAAQRLAPECLALTHAYGQWCERQGRARDCLSLLKEGPVLLPVLRHSPGGKSGGRATRRSRLRSDEPQECR